MYTINIYKNVIVSNNDKDLTQITELILPNNRKRVKEWVRYSIKTQHGQRVLAISDSELQ